MNNVGLLIITTVPSVLHNVLMRVQLQSKLTCLLFCVGQAKTRKGKQHNWTMMQAAFVKVMKAAVELVDALHATGYPVLLIVGGCSRNWDPNDQRGFKEAYDQAAQWARTACVQRILQIYSNTRQKKPRIIVTSGVGLFDKMKNGPDEYHLHAGPNLEHMRAFGDGLVALMELAILA